MLQLFPFECLGGLGLALFCFFMIIYCIQRFGTSGDVSKGTQDSESSRGMYVRTATGPDDWEVEQEDEEEDDWRPTEI